MAKRSKSKRWAFVVAAVAMASLWTAESARAGAVACSAKVLNVAMTPGGELAIHAQGLGWWYMCQLQTTTNVNVYPTATGSNIVTIAPETCQALMAQMLTAKATQKDVLFYLDYNTLPTPSCASGMAGNWIIPNPYPYFMDLGN